MQRASDARRLGGASKVRLTRGWCTSARSGMRCTPLMASFLLSMAARCREVAGYLNKSLGGRVWREHFLVDLDYRLRYLRLFVLKGGE